MKKTIFLLSLMVISMAVQARIWRVNNMPGVTADATTAQQAHDLASNGDIIHLEASPTTYGTVYSNKQLTWLSLGVYLPENPGNQASAIPGIIGSMYFQAGSEGSIAMVYSNGYAYVYTNNVTITRSWFNGIHNQASAITGFVITQNFVYFDISLGNAVNAIVSNNIVGYAVSNGTSGTSVVSNNVFGTYSAVTGTLYNSVFQNNILKSNLYNFYNSVASYNWTSSPGGLPPGNNNEFNVNLSNVFENDGLTHQGRVDKDYRLKAGSPALGAGSGGVDIGAFGGSSPFVLALQPNIPAITAMSTPSSSSSNTIQVTFSAKSNN